jgi:TPR repeat protein
MMRIFLLLLTIAATTVLSGCNEKMNTEISYNLSAITEAKKFADPWAAYKNLDERYKVATDEWGELCTDLFSTGSNCGFNASRKALATEKERYLKLAIAQSNPQAFIALFNLDSDADAEKKDVAPKILQAADNSDNPELLLLAGKILGNGQFVVRDTSRAIVYLARSWALGNTEAAMEASKQFKAINDIPNAYLWSLRCTAGCKRDYTLTLDVFEHDLSPAAAKQVQKAASDPTIIDLDTNS